MIKLDGGMFCLISLNSIRGGYVLIKELDIA
jgi:hypothetical protein